MGLNSAVSPDFLSWSIVFPSVKWGNKVASSEDGDTSEQLVPATLQMLGEFGVCH